MVFFQSCFIPNSGCHCSGNKFSKSCLKRPLQKEAKIGFQGRLSFNAGQKYCRMLQGEHSAILLTFIKYHLLLRPLLCLFLSDRFTQVLLYLKVVLLQVVLGRPLFRMLKLNCLYESNRLPGLKIIKKKQLAYFQSIFTYGPLQQSLKILAQFQSWGLLLACVSPSICVSVPSSHFLHQSYVWNCAC